jgi:hypothetical protein
VVTEERRYLARKRWISSFERRQERATRERWCRNERIKRVFDLLRIEWRLRSHAAVLLVGSFELGARKLENLSGFYTELCTSTVFDPTFDTA